jgi:hypothetical protein
LGYLLECAVGELNDDVYELRSQFWYRLGLNIDVVLVKLSSALRLERLENIELQTFVLL